MPRIIYRAYSVSLLLTAGVMFAHSAAFADSKPKELMKYFNPLPQKNYVNESQDRIIKKKSFKIRELIETKPVVNKEQGFFAIIPSAKLSDLDYVKGVLANPRVNGISVAVPWKTLEPGELEFNWSSVDNLLSCCSEANKYLILRVATCGTPDEQASGAASDTPKWLFDAGVKSITYTGEDGKQYQAPIFWDTNYMAQWSNFIRQLGTRYDKNQFIHSIGITGGGIGGGTCVVPAFGANTKTEPASDKPATSFTSGKEMLESLKKDHGMTPKQLVEHWQYVVDAFAKRFPTARLNLNINAPINNRAGEDLLDQITDHSVYKYGQRIYLTRTNVDYDRHGFDDYRVLLKFRNDTVTGLQLAEAVKPEEMEKIAKHSLDDGLSFMEIPASMLESKDEATIKALDNLAKHMGYQIISQKAQLPAEVSIGSPLVATFEFANLGDSSPLRPERQLEKDLPVSYKIQIELRDKDGKAVVQSLHTPSTPTNKWVPGQKITWQVDLKMPELIPGEYSAWMSIIDPISKQKVKYGNGIAGTDKMQPVLDAEVGKVKVVSKTSAASVPATGESSVPTKTVETN